MLSVAGDGATTAGSKLGIVHNSRIIPISTKYFQLVPHGTEIVVQCGTKFDFSGFKSINQPTEAFQHEHIKQSGGDHRVVHWVLRMKFLLFSAGILVGSALLSLLLATVYSRHFRFWPTPGAGTWQSYAFWSLFRSLNVLCFAVGIADRGAAFIGLPTAIRIFAGVILAFSLLVFRYSFVVLGRDNSYGAQQGLVTDGIYHWTRNPQNTILIVVYGALAVAVDSGATFVLAVAMMAVYALMVLAEEPWLRGRYGAAYDDYCHSVPRFFNWRRGFWKLIPFEKTVRDTAKSVETSLNLLNPSNN